MSGGRIPRRPRNRIVEVPLRPYLRDVILPNLERRVPIWQAEVKRLRGEAQDSDRDIRQWFWIDGRWQDGRKLRDAPRPRPGFVEAAATVACLKRAKGILASLERDLRMLQAQTLNRSQVANA